MEAGSRSDAKRFLLDIPVFGGLGDRPMDKLLELIEARCFQPGEVVCAEGDPGREMYVVRSGSVEVVKRGRCLARLGVGDCFGEMSLIDIQPRSATVVTTTESELYVLSNRDFYALYRHDLEGYTFLVMNICRELSRRLRAANATIADFSLRPPPRIVARDPTGPR